MKGLIKEVALDIANKLDPERAKLGGDFQFGFNTVQLFGELVVAELTARAEASCVAFQHEDTGRTTSVAHDEADDFERLNQRWFKVGPLFTFPPIHDIEAIENRTAEVERLKVEVARVTEGWRTAFNCGIQHQEQDRQLRQQLAECQAREISLSRTIGDIKNHPHKTNWIIDWCNEALALPNDATALNELIAERMKTQKEYYESVIQDGANRIAELTAEVNNLKAQIAHLEYQYRP